MHYILCDIWLFSCSFIINIEVFLHDSYESALKHAHMVFLSTVFPIFPVNPQNHRPDKVSQGKVHPWSLFVWYVNLGAKFSWAKGVGQLPLVGRLSLVVTIPWQILLG